jgi:hypothetical protein
MKITAYVTVVSDDLKTLDKLVNEHIKDGYQPFGNQYYIGQTEGNSDAPICQPMVKYSN